MCLNLSVFSAIIKSMTIVAEAPVYAGSVLGWHNWRWDDERQRLGSVLTLGSRYAQVANWPPGEEYVAKCQVGGKHAVPDENCSCGIYSSLRPTDRQIRLSAINPLMIHGVIASQGGIVPSITEIRGERARVVAIGCYHRGGCYCQKAARVYGVPCYLNPQYELWELVAQGHFYGADECEIWGAYGVVFNNLLGLVAYEYGIDQAAGRDVPDALGELQRTWQIPTVARGSAEWWEAVLLRLRKSTPDATALVEYLQRHLEIPGGNEDKTAIAPTIEILVRSALLGQVNSAVGELFEFARSQWRQGIGVLRAVPETSLAIEL